MSVQIPLFEKTEAKGSKVAAAVEHIVGAGFDVKKFVENFDVLLDAEGGIEHVRGLIIDLAIRGRLGTQNKGDASATGLVERARATLGPGRKRRTIDLPPPALELPSNWAWCEPQDLGEVSPRNDAADELPVGFVPMTHVPIDYRRPVVAETRPWKDIKKGYTHLANSDIAVAKITPCFQNGKSCVMAGLPNGLGAGTTELLVLRPVPGVVEPKYLLLFFKSPEFIVRGTSLMTGTAGQQRVPVEYFAAVPLPLPPLAEQKRIVAKVDQLMALCDELEARQTKKRETEARLTKSALEALTTAEGPDEFDAAWTNVVSNFDVLFDRAEKVGDLKRAVVALALRGALLEQSPAEGSASDLISRIGASRATEAWTEEPGLPLPATWRWLPLAALVTWGPKNGYSPKAVEYETRVRSLTLTATTSGKFDPQYFKYIDEPIAADSDLWLRDGDVLVQRGNTIEYVGVAAIYRGPERTFIYPDLMMKFRVSQEMDLDFVHMALNGPVARGFIMSRASGTSGSMPKINQATLMAIPIPLPPAEEQRRIMKKVAAIEAICDQLKELLLRAEDRASKLVEAVVQELVA